MEKKPNGIISLAYESLKLHIQTLLDEVGGEKACELMDALADIEPAQRDRLIESMIKVARSQKAAIARIEGTAAIVENELYKEINKQLSPKLEVVGGKRPVKEPINLEEARKNRPSRPTLH